MARYPKLIAYGADDDGDAADDGDARLEFVYLAREDAEPAASGGVARAGHLLLHTVRATLAGRPVREYRLISETRNGWRRLDKLQLCGYDENGASPQCLRALDVDWMQAAGAQAAYKTCVDGLTDPLGRRTEFSYEKIGTAMSATSTALFPERPFGAAGTPAGAKMGRRWATLRRSIRSPTWRSKRTM